MAKEAEAHAEEDKKKRESIDARNQLDSSMYQAEKMKTDNKDKISEEDAKAIDTAVETAKKVAEDKDADKETLEKAAKELSDAIMPIGAKMYEAAAKEESANKSDEDSKDKDEPVEGEVVEDDKDDKDDK